ncbi:MAG: type VI secretion system tip protein VgrG [Polyangiaceae bacterium]|nr:type VI secretion system tip protein VgrG [Polyangiaceae bacterium]
MPLENILVEPTIDVDGTSYRVLRYDILDEMFELPRLHCEIMNDEGDVPDPASIVDKAVEFILHRSDGAPKRYFYGKIASVERAPNSDDIKTLHLEVLPALWQLQKRADCRIFQKKSVVDIVKAVLEGAGVPADQQEWNTTESYSPRVYVVQYRESDFDFVRRLCSEEGIYFAVHHKGGKDVVVFGDKPDGFGDVEGTKLLSFIVEMGAHGAVDKTMRVSRSVKVKSDKVTLRDYNPEKPKLKLEATVEGTDEGAHALEVYMYPGRFEDPGAGKRLAQIMLDSMQAERDMVKGDTGSLALMPGLRIEIDEHPYDPINEEYMVTRVRLHGTTPRMGQQKGAENQAPKFTCEFWGVPTSTVKYRPPRLSREVMMPGVQSAFTTGPSGQEIHVDGAGQVKAQFHWDRLGKKDDESSRWMRTSQLPTGGSMFLPRMKWEVSIRHNEGDADRPYVMGRLYNGTTPPPYALPKESAKSSIQTATTPGGGSSNEIRTGDSKGAEEMFFNASKDMSIEVKNNITESVGNDMTRKIGSNQKKDVTDSTSANVGSNQKIQVSGNQSIKVETFMVDDIGGNYELKIGGNRDMKIGGDHKRDVGGASTLEVGGMMIDLVVGSITDKTLGSFTHDVGSAQLLITVGSHQVTVGGNRTENTGAVKIIATRAGRGVDVGGNMTTKVIGAIVNIANGDRAEKAGGMFTEVAAGAQLVKATNVTFEATGMLAVVMGASTLVMLPALVLIAGISAKLDGNTADLGIIIDN